MVRNTEAIVGFIVFVEDGAELKIDDVSRAKQLYLPRK
jgi:hypothetical protein